MEKEQTDSQEQNQEVSNTEKDTQQKVGSPSETSEEVKELSPEDKITELEDKLARTFAEMENQRRRFEKEKEDAFEYGGSSFAKEALSLIDNLERSKVVLESDDTLKNTEALKKTLEHFDIIIKDLSLDELVNADEAFFTGTASEVTPVVSLDDKKINNGHIGEITNQLKQLYMDIVLGKSEKHLPWLTFIK